MTVKEFAQLVAKMRELQRRFYAGDKSLLPACKKVEREVDEALKRSVTLNNSPQASQGKLL